MSWRAMYVMGTLSFLLVGVLATSGCRHGGRDTIAAQPFRDETDPSDGFQFYESAVPAGADGSAKSSGESATETTVEVEIDDGSGEGSQTAASRHDDEAAGDDEDDASDDGDEDGDGGEDTSGGDEDDGGVPGQVHPGHAHRGP